MAAASPRRPTGRPLQDYASAGTGRLLPTQAGTERSPRRHHPRRALRTRGRGVLVVATGQTGRQSRAPASGESPRPTSSVTGAGWSGRGLTSTTRRRATRQGRARGAEGETPSANRVVRTINGSG